MGMLLKSIYIFVNENGKGLFSIFAKRLYIA